MRFAVTIKPLETGFVISSRASLNEYRGADGPERFVAIDDDVPAAFERAWREREMVALLIPNNDEDCF